MKRETFLVRGVVQGVGFRPYVYRLARRYDLAGTVCNTSTQVIVDAQGSASSLDAFAAALPLEAPPLAQVLDVERIEGRVDEGLGTFAIVGSADEAGARTIVPPDSALCEQCRAELFDPASRYFRHPFITCTNCGPRFTIIRSLPYDRPATTMAPFAMCPECEREYHDPSSRRFHAQPISCPVCSPHLTHHPTPTKTRPRSVCAPTETVCAPTETVCAPTETVCAPNASWVRNTSRHADGGDHMRTQRTNAQVLQRAGKELAGGGIIGVKGIGGYHLACSALDGAAVAKLRERKGREAKPLAVMVPDLATAQMIAHVSEVEARELTSPAAPIVLLHRRPTCEVPPELQVAAEVAPGNDELGVMIAYTGLHLLLFDLGAPRVLVMTSGNVSGEPICFRDDDAIARLGHIADAIVCHDREIVVPCDDSVIRVIGDQVHPLRRSRGYTPLPLQLQPVPTPTPSTVCAPNASWVRNTSRHADGEPHLRTQPDQLRTQQATPPDGEPHLRTQPDQLRTQPNPTPNPASTTPTTPSPTTPSPTAPAVLALGGELKATVCLLDGQRAYLSQHLGDMESLAGQQALAQAAEHLAALYGVEPAAWACDLHPDYHATRWAKRSHGSLPLLQVQHHHAHAVSLLAEHCAIGREALVFAFDGTGYGSDGVIWGGEVLRIAADPSRFERTGHLREVRLPGGDAAIAEPWRIALAHLAAAGLDWDADLPCVQAAGDDAPRLRQLLASERATTPCTSIGRLFDAVSSLLGICHRARYEGQAAIELEQAARRGRAPQLPNTAPFEVRIDADGVLDPTPLLTGLVAALRAGVPAELLARAFHGWLAHAVAEWARREAASGIELAGLSGGVFANALLTELCAGLLTQSPHLTVLTHEAVPAGDGGLALGQAVIAAHTIARGEAHLPAATGRN